MRRRMVAAAAAAAAVLGCAAPAHAGTYEVRSCATNVGNFPNEAWSPRAATGVTADVRCGTSSTDGIGLTAAAGAVMTDATYAALTFTAPAGTAITDFTINRRWRRTGVPASGNHRPYLLYVLGSSTVFGGAGTYTASVRDALNKQKSWAGYPEADTVSISGTTTRASWGSLTSYANDQRVLSVRLGCASAGTPCGIPAGGVADNTMIGARVTVSDPTAPTVSVQAAGLLAGGARSGSDPVTLSASDASGIRSVELLDVTNPAAPAVVGAESYDPAAPIVATTDKGEGCRFTKPAPCPQLSGETLVPTLLAAGNRTLLVRVTDAAGNVTDSTPYPVAVATPSDRGTPNGENATDTATITGGFTGKKKAPRARTVGYGRRPEIRGTLRNSAGQPIGGAQLHVATREAGSERWVARGTIRTGANGNWKLKPSAGPSRIVRVGWRARTRDAIAASRVDLDLHVRGTASLAAPKRVSLGRSFSLKGRLKGAKRNTRVNVVAQGKTGRARFATFRLGRTNAKGRFTLRYRFSAASSRGRVFKLRVRVLPQRSWPYAAGTTKTVRVRVR